MMGDLVKIVAGFFGGPGAAVGGVVANVGALAALLAALAPIALWMIGHKGDTFIVLTYGDLAFWFSLIGAFVFAVIKVAHYTRAPG